MPAPPLPPVPLDGPAVAAAIDACTRAAALVVRLADARASAASVARRDWRGAARDHFDEAVARLDHDAAGLAADLGRLAGALGAAAAENRRRAEVALRWQPAGAAATGLG